MELTVYYHILQDDAVKEILTGRAEKAMRSVIAFAETQGVSNHAVREYIISALANDDNVLSHLAQKGRTIGNDLYEYALRDITFIYEMMDTPACFVYRPSAPFDGFYDGYTASIRALTEAPDAKELLNRLLEHYRMLGNGVLSKYIAFRYDGQFMGIPHTDTITFDDLVGIDYQKQVLIDNTTAFLSGRQANNVLLFGDRGSGKSSSIKALLNRYYQDGLRMIEIPKHHIADIPALSASLAPKPHKYILFLDDLTFESHETEYRALKIAMDGQLQANPENVLIYATSNRRHLIKETWSDREGGEVHINDNMQEMLSLSERFGISLVFSAPSNQKEYLNIVRQLLLAKGIELTPEIEQQAIVWQMNYGSRSGRCASQFAASYAAKAHLS